MGWTGLIILLLILLLGGYYIYTVTHVTKMDSIARNAGGELDTLIWDRNHVYEQITAKLQEHGIELDEKLTKKLGLGLGMTPSVQMANYTELHRRWTQLLPIMEEHPELKEDEALEKLKARFADLRVETMKAESKYNRAATDFNAYIQKPFPGFIAARKTKGTRSNFNVVLAEANSNDPLSHI